MAKIKLRFGENEVEVESRDFYIDNETLGEVIANITKHIQENNAQMIAKEQSIKNFDDNTDTYNVTKDTLTCLDDAEIHEPEFDNPEPIMDSEITNKLKILEKNSFFNSPRTVSETIERLRESGWSARPFDVSKALTKMAFKSEISKNVNKGKIFYLKKYPILIG